ncbi:MAG: CPBP family intramembrane metalloprotease, partial [Chitinivibrionales bacterium]|nr:CPBP family intramembrane metalloprotease [Chitinivibrionales bacterium]
MKKRQEPETAHELSLLYEVTAYEWHLKRKDSTLQDQKRVLLFLLSTFIFSWLFWTLNILLGGGVSMVLISLGILGPSLMGLLFSTIAVAKPLRREFWSRLVSLKRIGIRLFFCMPLLFILLFGISIALHLLISGEPVDFKPMLSLYADPKKWVPFVVLMFLGGPLFEEIGWRGFLLDPMVKRFGLRSGTVVLGGIWAVWHLPLFLMPGTTQYSMGLFSIAGLCFMANTICLSVIISWFYYKTAQSILGAVLLHFWHNFLLTSFMGFGKSMDMTFTVALLLIFSLTAGLVFTKGFDLLEKKAVDSGYNRVVSQ